MDALLDVPGAVTFFGGLVAGYRAGDWLVGRLLAGEPWLDRGEFRDACPRRAWVRHALLPWQVACTLTGFGLVVALLQDASWVLLFGGLVLGLWMELMPWAALAVVFGVWVEPMSKRVPPPLRVIASGPVRRAGLVGVGLTPG